MNPSGFTERVWLLVSPMSWRTLLVVLATTILLSAVIYSLLTGLTNNGLYCNTNNGCVARWYDGLYFSVITEATVGYGDLVPTGWSRLLAAFQALAGPTIFGMMVSKIAAHPGRTLSTIVERCSGEWIEMTWIRESGTVVVSLTTMAHVEDCFRYDGVNFDQHGLSIGSFMGVLEDHAKMGTSLSFKYTNRHDKNTEFFDDGITYLKFDNFRMRKYWTFSGRAIDSTMGKKDFVGGWRVNQSNSETIRNGDDASCGALARRWAAHYLGGRPFTREWIEANGVVPDQ